MKQKEGREPENFERLEIADLFGELHQTIETQE
jgi:hypothetical protein